MISPGKLKPSFWPEKGMKRKLKYWRSKYLHPIGKRRLVAGFRELGIREGMVVTVHSTMSALGYVKGGGETIVEALFEAMGGPERGTVMMPAFSMPGSMQVFLDEQRGRTLDLRTQPSAVGQLTETFRRMPGVMRSAHPSHSVCAMGKDAEALLRDNEQSPTPFGLDTPYGRWSHLDEGYLLLLHNNFGTIMHVAQEEVAEFPTLYVPEHRERVEFLDAEGTPRVTETAVLTRSINACLLQPPETRKGEQRPFVWLGHWPFPFPEARRKMLEEFEYHDYNIDRWRRHERALVDGGILREVKVGPAGLGLVKADACLDFLKADLRELLAASREDWTEEQLRECMGVVKHLPRR